MNTRWNDAATEPKPEPEIARSVTEAMKAKGMEYQQIAQRYEKAGRHSLAASLETAGYVLYAGAVEEEARLNDTCKRGE